MIYVYYQDEYCEMGGHGLEECLDRKAAAEFIQERMSKRPVATFDSYTIIEGEKLTPVAVAMVTKIRLE